MKFYLSSRTRLGVTLVGANVVALVLYGLGFVVNGDMPYGYLLSNLAVAWVPLLLALWLVRLLRTHVWSNWLPLLVTILWLAFIPNGFYIVSDLIHLQEIPRHDVLFDAIVFAAFVLNNVVLGYLSIFLVHQQLTKRLKTWLSSLLIGLVLVLCSFGVYTGRDLRWSTWDIVINPISMIVDVSDRFINPGAHPGAWWATLGFSLLFGSIYVVIWQLSRVARTGKP